MGGAPGASVVVGVLERRGRFLTANPLFARGRRITLDRTGGGAGTARAHPGDLVLVSPHGSGAGHGKVLRRLGSPDVARDVLEGLMLDAGLRRRFDPAVERAAREAAAHPPGGEVEARRDLRDLTTFTVDPPTARDFDDAISAERLDGDRTRIWVHIADVSAHVRPDSPVDREARRRATSVYVPGAVEPMLPESLSNGACSLGLGKDRLAVTVELEFDGHDVVRTAFYRSLVRSDARLDYPQVDRVFAGVERPQAPWADPLEAAREVSAALEARRAQRGSLAVESSEPEFTFDADGHVASVERAEGTEAHRLIEHLMIAANEAVAGLLEDRKLPTLYRIHERPDPPRVERLIDQLASLDVPTPPVPEAMTPQQAEVLAGEISRMVDAHVRRIGHGRAALTSLVLRALKPARYAPENLGHAGLRSARYCHFTSPIRRYPDLVCHRALLAAIGAGEEAPTAAPMSDLGEWCSTRERAAMVVERRADDVARCFKLESELIARGPDELAWEGEVVGVIGAGAFVAFGTGHEGMLPVRRLRGDWWELNAEETMLVGTQSDAALRLGDPISVQIERVDAPRGRVDLSPID